MFYQLKQMRPFFSRVIFLTNSFVDQETQDKLTNAQLITDFIQRKNQGYDFLAWKEGLYFVSEEELLAFDSLVLMNDTCFGPLWDMTAYFEKYDLAPSVDFWGITNHRRTISFPEHIQSYFLCFKKKVFLSETFRAFWEKVEALTDVLEVILSYETQLTKELVQAGFDYQVIFNSKWRFTKYWRSPDFTYYEPQKMLNANVPFIKVKAFKSGLVDKNILLDMIERDSDYPIQLIKDNLE
ncbi:rhamnan synthesis F family protein [Streptococcus plurextorum]|uniref:rhamnan synthesis F family protein n=1 Tax=Streptococcus plurextorum TaxID=456876 RepID=UPI00146DA5D5|nr:rhamnan synthesis F family protein [Streptococcus plurextorum]